MPAAAVGCQIASSWRACLRELNLEWGDLPSKAGHLRGLQLRATPADGGWNIDGRGGQIVAAGLPELEVGAIALRQRERSLFINSADFTQSGGGSAHVSGEVRADDRIDLQAQLNGIDLAPFLSNDWRLRLHGKLTGEVRIQTPLPVRDAVGVSGSLHVVGGQIDALPVLDEIAVFTRTQQYRRIALTNASGDFERDGKRLAVKNLVAEAQGLIRIEGAFTIADAQIDGTFQVGVTPASLQWLPGSQERVFTEARAGYVWAPMRLTGPVDSPKEDLSRRLIVAAGDAVVDKVESTARDAIKTGREAAKGALDYLMPLLK